MKVIFLDIDGVLNSRKYMEILMDACEQGKINKKTLMSIFDLPQPKALTALAKIVQKTGAKIVLTSTWRLSAQQMSRLNREFSKYNLSIFDCTVSGVAVNKILELGFKPDSEYTNLKGIAYTTDRGAEIAEWLSRNNEVESFVILDDDSADILPYFPHELVKTDYNGYGLTDELANKAIKILV